MITIEGRMMSSEVVITEGKRVYLLEKKKGAFEMRNMKRKTLAVFDYSSLKDVITIFSGGEKMQVSFHMFKPDEAVFGKRKFLIHQKFFGKIMVLSGKDIVIEGSNDLMRMVFERIDPEVKDIAKELCTALYIRYRVFSQNF